MQADPPRTSFRERTRRFDPDFVYWRTKELWSLNEAVKLICGRDPVQKYPTPQLYNKPRKVIEIIDIAFEAVKDGQLKPVRNALIPIHIQVNPREFLRWAHRQGFSMPPELRDLADPRAGAAANLDEHELREKAVTIARTLQIVDPTMSLEDVRGHAAMRQLLGDEPPATEILAAWLKTQI